MTLAHHDYTACGLAISSDAPIPGLRVTGHAATPDLLVAMTDSTPWTQGGFASERVRYSSPWRDESGTPLLTVWARQDGTHRLRYSEGAEFIVDGAGRRIDIRWDAPLTDADAAIFLLGPVLAFFMRLRGIIPLHASAVVVGGRGVVFAGDAGAGKSTTAAAFAALGYPVLSDDLVPIVDVEDAMLACPGHPRLTVWPESAAALFGSPDALPALTATYSKRYLDLDAPYLHQITPVPIGVIYVLGERAAAQACAIRALTPRAALMALVTHTYGTYLLDAPMRADEFDLLSRVARRIPVREVTFSDDIEQLSDLCEQLAMKQVMQG